ncbi:MAG: hypothetical protein JWM32_3058 [Verrucomicrobia bacterium]|nr:hypothetical protein [Verrucomicrobiota bacterium]
MATIIDHTIKTRLLLRPVRSPLGSVLLAGINKEGTGVGIATNRTRNRGIYSLNYILNGNGLYRDANGIACAVPAESAVIFFPHIAHACGTVPGQFWDEFWFEFEGPVFDLMRRGGLLNPKRPVQPALGRDYWFRRMFAIIPPVHLRHKTPADSIVAHFVAVLTDMLSAHRSPAEPVKQTDWLDQACRLLTEDEKMAASSLGAVARRLGCSYGQFRKRFRIEMGFSPGQFRMDARIDRSAALLHQGQHSIKEIAQQLGFCDEFYFSRCFKRRFGQAPKLFRRSVRGH